MSRADIIKEIADHHYALADLFTQLASDSAAVPVSTAQPAAAASPPPAAPARRPQEADFLEGSERVCPIHKVEMKPKPFDPSIYGCTRQGTDPAWTNAKGYCTITSKNVGTYLQHRTAAA